MAALLIVNCLLIAKLDLLMSLLPLLTSSRNNTIISMVVRRNVFGGNILGGATFEILMARGLTKVLKNRIAKG